METYSIQVVHKNHWEFKNTIQSTQGIVIAGVQVTFLVHICETLSKHHVNDQYVTQLVSSFDTDCIFGSLVDSMETLHQR